MNDGDTIFALATGRDDDRTIGQRSVAVDTLNRILDLSADVFAEACTSAILAATPRGGPPAYADFLVPPRPSRRAKV
jgi:L-aminopeptidase/D-esterase-like protein